MMDDSLFLGSDALGVLVGWVADFLVVGSLVALMFWAVGYVVFFVIEVLRGGF